MSTSIGQQNKSSNVDPGYIIDPKTKVKIITKGKDKMSLLKQLAAVYGIAQATKMLFGLK